MQDWKRQLHSSPDPLQNIPTLYGTDSYNRLRFKDSCEKKSQVSASFFRDIKINEIKMIVTGGFIRDTKNRYWVSRETHEQIQMGADSAVNSMAEKGILSSDICGFNRLRLICRSCTIGCLVAARSTSG